MRYMVSGTLTISINGIVMALLLAFFASVMNSNKMISMKRYRDIELNEILLCFTLLQDFFKKNFGDENDSNIIRYCHCPQIMLLEFHIFVIANNVLDVKTRNKIKLEVNMTKQINFIKLLVFYFQMFFFHFQQRRFSVVLF